MTWSSPPEYGPHGPWTPPASTTSAWVSGHPTRGDPISLSSHPYVLSVLNGCRPSRTPAPQFLTNEHHPKFPELKVERLDIDAANVIIPFLLFSSSTVHTLKELHIGPFTKPSAELVNLVNASPLLRHIDIVPEVPLSRLVNLHLPTTPPALQRSAPQYIVGIRPFRHIQSLHCTILLQSQLLAEENGVYGALGRKRWMPPTLRSLTIILDLVTVYRPVILYVVPISLVKALEKTLPLCAFSILPTLCAGNGLTTP